MRDDAPSSLAFRPGIALIALLRCQPGRNGRSCGTTNCRRRHDMPRMKAVMAAHLVMEKEGVTQAFGGDA
jgi:hypothetical protein